MKTLEVLLGALFGLLVGSFLNVVIYRVPLGKSIVAPPSQCPKCDHRLSPLENIPVVSYLLLGGKCKGCSEPISIRYPIIELLSASCVAAMFYHFDQVLQAVGFSVFICVAIVLGVIDLDTRTLPRKIMYVSAPLSVGILAVAAIARSQPRSVVDAVIGAAIGLIVFGAIHFVAPRSMGMGDVRFAGYIGLNLGFLGLFAVVDFIYGAFLVGALFGIGFALLKSKTLRVAIPFGPFMSFAAVLAIFFAASVHIF